jgi:hypothetical protein
MPVPELAHFVQSVTHAISSPGIESERKNISMQPADLNFSIAEMTAGKGEKIGESSEIAQFIKRP